nr:glycosyltransferase [Candidatus Woesebacteria bacterium]
MQQKTVLLTFYDLGYGGIQTKLISVANALATGGVNTILILERHVSGERTELLHKNVKVIYSPQFLPKIFKKRYYISLLFYSMFFQAHSLVVSLEDTSVFVLNWNKFIPFWKTKVVINYDLLPSAQQKMPAHKLGSILNRADSIVAVSKEVQKELVQKIGVSSKKIEYIPNWFDEILDKKNMKLLRIENRFLFAGRFSSQKQPIEALRVFSIIKNNLNSAQLHFYGTGELLSSLQKFGEKEGAAVK